MLTGRRFLLCGAKACDRAWDTLVARRRRVTLKARRAVARERWRREVERRAALVGADEGMAAALRSVLDAADARVREQADEDRRG